MSNSAMPVISVNVIVNAILWHMIPPDIQQDIEWNFHAIVSKSNDLPVTIHHTLAPPYKGVGNAHFVQCVADQRVDFNLHKEAIEAYLDLRTKLMKSAIFLDIYLSKRRAHWKAVLDHIPPRDRLYSEAYQLMTTSMYALAPKEVLDSPDLVNAVKNDIRVTASMSNASLDEYKHLERKYADVPEDFKKDELEGYQEFLELITLRRVME